MACTWLLLFAVAIILNSIDPCLALSKDDPSVEVLVRKYWTQHKKYAVILAYLRLVHHISCGMTWLKKKIKQLGLHRRGDLVSYTPVTVVTRAIMSELRGVNGSIGYRQMWRVLQDKYQFQVKRSTVMMLLKMLDPEGSAQRRRHRLRRRVYQNKGPNFVWHLDGYDKLTPYGFPIHACIDGYSRKIIWIRVAMSNKDSSVILLYYLLAVFVNKGVPMIIRSDCGTENASLAACHMLLRHNHTDEFSKEKSYRYGSSTTNTRIESWWAQLRKSVSDFWINLFKDLIGRGLYNPNIPVQKHCIAFVYGPLLENSLNEFKERWNTHSIRTSRLAGCPAGVPDDLFNLPQLHGTVNFIKNLDADAWCYSYVNYAQQPEPFYPDEFYNAAVAILQTDLNLQPSDINIENAETVYKHLLNIFS